MSRKIYLIGDIDHSMHSKLTRRMARLEESTEDISIVLSSDGGMSSVAFAMYDRIKMSPCNVNVVGTGLVASAAVLILAAGKHRSLTSNAWVMVHDDTTAIRKSDRIVHAVKAVKQGRRVERQWNRLMAQNSKTPDWYWDKLHQKETHLTPAQCLRLGLIEEII